MKIIGFLIIINALVITCWRVSLDHAHKSWVITVCLLALFSGAFMILQDRAIELTFKGVGTIKAAQEQASVDAATVAHLKERVEVRDATVDLIAREAASIVAQLCGIACTTARAILTELMAANFIGGTTLKGTLGFIRTDRG